MTTHSYQIFLLILFVLMSTRRAKSAEILDTADGDPNQSTFSIVLSDQVWPAHRFEVTGPGVNVSAVGGSFRTNQPDAFDAFAAIVELSGPSDFPDSSDLSTPDLHTTATITIPPDHFGFLSTALPTSLIPGWYALVFGTGAFGATSFGGDPFAGGGMIELPIDSHPQFPFAIRQDTGEFALQGISPEFVVEGTAIPEPLSIFPFTIGTLWCMGRRRPD